jgi:kynurenine 3-monooxygenase
VTELVTELITKQTSTALIKNKVTIAGAGPVGAMLAIVLARNNCNVDVFESRPDPKTHNTPQGKSINITLSERAWTALTHIGLEQQVRQYATPLYQRIFHQSSGEVTKKNYGKEAQAIWSISRNKLTEIILNQVRNESRVNIHFEQRLTHLDFNSACASFCQVKVGEHSHREIDADYVFAADGAFSKIRRLAQETPRFSYSQRYMKQCYIELTIATHEDGRSKLNANACHLWPREDFLLIALPNEDGSFTCTLYLNYQGDPSFTSLKTPEAVGQFFVEYFSDVMSLLENPIETFLNKTANPLFLVSVDPWIIGKVALIGDAAHAMVPFFGQGLNCSFEDCIDLAKLMTSHQGDLAKILPIYYQQRKNNADAISKLSNEYFIEINRSNEDINKLLSKRIADKFSLKYPMLWPSLDQMVCFSPEIPYSRVREISLQQKSILAEIMQTPNIEHCWQQDFIYLQLKAIVLEKLAPLLD